MFVRYRAKNDLFIARELQSMNISLGDAGTEILANYKNIQKRLEYIWNRFTNIRDPNFLDVTLNEDAESVMKVP